MTRYSLLVSLHVASVIIWLGSGTTLVFVAIYAQRARNRVVLEQLGALVQWMALRVFAPAVLAGGLLAAVTVAYRARSARPAIAVSPLREYGTIEDGSGRESESESTGSRAA
jgi:uncharacterized membrane protein